MKAVSRKLTRVFRDVHALGDLSELWFLAAVLAAGPGAVVSHLSALQLMDLRPMRAGDIHVTLPKRSGREQPYGLIFHRPRTPPEVWRYKDVPVASPTQSLTDADLRPHALYRALDLAEERGSEAEARFILLCRDNGLPLPLVNQPSTDFHWPELQLVVDGWEHHKERPTFNSDRYRRQRLRGHQDQRGPRLRPAGADPRGADLLAGVVAELHRDEREDDPDGDVHEVVHDPRVARCGA